jgi:hypothetical protein
MAADDEPTVPAECCGLGGAWAHPAGSRLVLGCQLCPQSPTYWRTHRADGRPYVPVEPLGGHDPTTPDR